MLVNLQGYVPGDLEWQDDPIGPLINSQKVLTLRPCSASRNLFLYLHNTASEFFNSCPAEILRNKLKKREVLI